MPNAALTLEAILVPLWVGIVGLKMCGDKAPKSRYHTWTCNTELPFSKTQQSCEYKQHQTTVTLAHILEATYETSDLSTNGSHIKGICFCVCESEESGHQVIEFRRQATELRVLFCSWSGHSTQCPMPFKLKGSSFLHVCVGCTHMLQCTHGTSLLAVMQPSLPTMGCASNHDDMMIHGESSWFIMTSHHDASQWCIMMMHHNDSSWWAMTLHDESWWFIIINHHVAFLVPLAPSINATHLLMVPMPFFHGAHRMFPGRGPPNGNCSSQGATTNIS